jgi:hypothetical protein
MHILKDKHGFTWEVNVPSMDINEFVYQFNNFEFKEGVCFDGGVSYDVIFDGVRIGGAHVYREE